MPPFIRWKRRFLAPALLARSNGAGAPFAERLPPGFVLEGQAISLRAGQLAGRGVVEDHRAIRMQLQSRGRDQWRDRTCNGFGHDLGLSFTRGQKETAAGIKNGSDSDGDGEAGHLV